MKREIIIATLCLIAISSFAQKEKKLSLKFEQVNVQIVLDYYGELTRKRVDLVQGDHQPFNLELYEVTKEVIINQIEHGLKNRNLKLYKISDDHLVASWIKVPEKKKKEYPRRRRKSIPEDVFNHSNKKKNNKSNQRVDFTVNNVVDLGETL